MMRLENCREAFGLRSRFWGGLVCSGQNFPEFQQRQFRDDIGENTCLLDRCLQELRMDHRNVNSTSLRTWWEC